MPSKGYKKNQPVALYYVYEHYRLDTNTVFYVGLGTQASKRFDFFRAHLPGRNSIWQRIVNKTGYRVEIVYVDSDYSKVQTKEKELIAQYGRMCNKTGCLANLTEGGEGEHYEMREETKQKISAKVKQFYVDNPEAKAAMGLKWKGRKPINMRPVLQLSLSGEILSEFESAQEAGNANGLGRSNIKNCLRGISKTAGGFLWKYKEV